MVPLGPGQAIARRKLRGRVEVGTLTEHLAAIHVRPIKIKGNDGVGWLAAAGMIFAYCQDEAAIGMDSDVAESEFGLGRNRPWRGSIPHRVQAAVSEFGVDDDAARDVVFAAAVLVHSVAYIGGCRGDLDRFTAGQWSTPEAGPASFVGPRLKPVDVFAVNLDCGKADRGTDQLINRDWRHPRSVRRNLHKLNVLIVLCARFGRHLVVQLGPMVQDREHTRSTSEIRPEDAGEGSPQAVFGLEVEDLA